MFPNIIITVDIPSSNLSKRDKTDDAGGPVKRLTAAIITAHGWLLSRRHDELVAGRVRKPGESWGALANETRDREDDDR